MSNKVGKGSRPAGSGASGGGQAIIVRPGEGAELPVTTRAIPSTDGTSIIHVTFDLKSAPVPERKYLAQAAWLLPGEGIDMVLAQRRPTSTGFLSAVVVSMTPEAVRNLLKACASGFLENAAAFLERNKIAIPALEEAPVEPGQVVHLAANITAAAHAGREAGLDLYQASAWALRAVESRRTIAVDPVLRVDLRTGLLVAILRGMKALEPLLPPDAT